MPIRDVNFEEDPYIRLPHGGVVSSGHAAFNLTSSWDQPLTHQNTVSVLRALASYKGQEGMAAISIPSSGPLGLLPGAWIQKAQSLLLAVCQTGWPPPIGLRAFRGEGDIGVEVLSVGCKTR